MGALIGLAIAASGAAGAVFQYTVPVATSRGESAAFLWVPPEAKQVRGAVVGGMTLMEFAWSDRNAAYLALWIRKAAEARLPATWPVGAKDPPPLKEIEHRRGWLTDLAIETPGGSGPAPYDEYRGDKAKAAWHFDQELAEATVAYHAGAFGRKDQFIKFGRGVEPLVQTAAPVEQTIRIEKGARLTGGG
jgi:hypothetical protein